IRDFHVTGVQTCALPIYAPGARTALGGAAPAPGEVAATLDALRAAGLLAARHPDPTSAAAWNAAYRRPLVPWAADACDADIALRPEQRRVAKASRVQMRT